MIYRANDLQGDEVKGHWCKVEGKHYMVLENAYFWLRVREEGIMRSPEINPTTLAQYTTVDDKHGNPIYGSFEYEENKFSKGGDRMQSLDGKRLFKVKWHIKSASWYLFGLDRAWCVNSPNWGQFEIIAPACQE